MDLACLAAMVLLITGCSGENAILEPNSSTNTVVHDVMAVAPDAGQVQLVAKVQTTDQNQRMLTFEGTPDTVVALQNCEIVRLENDNQSPIPFVDVGPGDSACVTGARMQNGYIYAHKIQVCSGDCDCLGYDVAFRDTIATIDYAAGTFTVIGSPETITVDSNTLIWGVITRYYGGPMYRKQDGGSSHAAGEGPGYTGSNSRDTILTLTDLEVGDIVEVRAFIVDSSTLLAGKIKLAGCNDIEKRCVEFSDYLASVDVETGTVTFANMAWVSLVCPGASLTGLDGTPLTLDGFIAGDYVYVKGFPLEGDTLKVCQMALTTP
jgi:hypothetical protein